MQDYFKKELSDSTVKIARLRKSDSFTFNVITDSHCHPNNKQWWQRYLNTEDNIEALNKATKIDANFHLGDIPWSGPEEFGVTNWTEENIDRELKAIKSRFCSFNENSFFVPGNHDGEGAREPKQEHWAELMLPAKSENVHTCGKPYYYVDFPEKKIRAVVMMSCFAEGEGCKYGYYAEQLEFLKQAFSSTPHNYKIFVFSHIAPIDVDARRLDNKQRFVDFIKAFHDRTTIENELVKADFRNVQAEIVAFFVGHGHVDWVGHGESFPYPVIETGANHVHVPEPSSWAMPADCTVAAREYGTYTEDLWDTVIYTPSENRISLIRFGAGEDREIILK